MRKIDIFDSTLRDGAQSEGITFSVEDKISIVKILDKLEIPYIEAGNPVSNPKEEKFFSEVKKLNLKSSDIVSFGSTRRKNISVYEDENLRALLKTSTKYTSIFGKTWDLHAEKILKTTLKENLLMIEESCKFLTDNGHKVFFDAEHFFDGYKANKTFALDCLKAAINGGADILVLCDTNGGTLPFDALEIVKEVTGQFKGVKFGIHAHNDSEMAVAISVMLAQAGISHIQGTLLGFGERCGNASLASVISNLQFKLGYSCIQDTKLSLLTKSCRQIAAIANVSIPKNTPYIGSSAFAHKAGMHVDAVSKIASSFEHINPSLIGNNRRILLSEMSGRTAIANKIEKINPKIGRQSPEIIAILNNIKELEKNGYQFEGADASFELIVRKHMKKYKPFFKLIYYKILTDSSSKNSLTMSAMVKVEVGNKQKITAAEGNGPVNALDLALREALKSFFPNLLNMYLMDYKVRVIDTQAGTASHVRVIISSSDGQSLWNTVGASSNVIDASLIALTDSIEYKLIKDSNQEKYNQTEKK